jgi:glyoxylase-like metal-dependent hydrolase (beta-lactamase superfamily II)
MNLIQLTEHIFYSECDSKVDRPVLGYIIGDNFSVMIDAGNSASHVFEYNRLLAEQGLRTPKYCILTHWHWDHTFGMHALEAETIACCKTNEELTRMSSWVWNDEAMKQRLQSGAEIEFADEHIRVEYSRLVDIKVVSAAITFNEKIVLDCGKITCECRHLTSAHSDDSVVIYIPEDKVIFIGDIYNDDFYNEHYRDLEKTEKLYQDLSKIDFDVAVVGHSKPVQKNDILNFLHKFF